MLHYTRFKEETVDNNNLSESTHNMSSSECALNMTMAFSLVYNEA